MKLHFSTGLVRPESPRYAPAIATTTPKSPRATVLLVYGPTALIWDGHTIHEAALASRLKMEADPSRSNPLAVGDEVTLEGGSPPRAPRRPDRAGAISRKSSRPTPIRP